MGCVGRSGLAALVAVSAIVLTTGAGARDLFTIEVDILDGPSDSRGFSSIEDVLDTVEDDAFQTINDAYTDMSIARAVIDFRNVGARLEFPSAGPEVRFVVPSIGFDRTFDRAGDGETRDDNLDDLIDFLENNQDNLLTDLLGQLVAESPVDPVAGNPNSLQSQMVAADFALGTSVGPSNSANLSQASGEDAPNLIGLPARFGRFTSDGFETNVIDLPLTYVIPLADPRYAVTFDAPLTYVEVEGGQSFAASFGTGLRIPIFDNWTITPAVRTGATGSVDLGAAAVLVSGSVTSNFEYEVFGVTAALGNSVSYVRSLPISAGDYDIDYELENYVLRNGLGVSGETGFTIFAEPVTWEVSAVNTQFFGDDLYVENATDLSFSLGTEASESGLTWDSFRLGLTYTFTDNDYQGFRVNFGYQF